MAMMDVWEDDEFLADYCEHTADPGQNWFEFEIGFQSLLSMIPANAQRILDYGCGSGEFTAKLAKHFPVVEGADYSQKMIGMATKSYPEIKFFVWKDLNQIPEVEPYDAIFSKLTVHLVPDLDVLARSVNQMLKPGGIFAFSSTNPIYSVSQVRDYWAVEQYTAKIGVQNMESPMYHRNFQNYVQPFLSAGFSLVEVVEPKAPSEIAQKYHVPADKLVIPSRLNLSFRKI